MRSLLVDDEALSRLNLRTLLAKYCPEVEVIGEAANVGEALALVKQNRPELLFLDIELNDATGFDLLKLLDTQREVEVIFVTAFDRYGVQAARACALDYLLKPIDFLELTKAVAKAGELVKLKKENFRLRELIANFDRRDEEKKIALPMSDKIEFVPISRIIRLEADSNYTRFFFEGNKASLVCRTLKEFEELLSPFNFLRTHQSHIVNCARISAYVKSEGGYILMDDGSQVPISRQKKEAIMKRIIG